MLTVNEKVGDMLRHLRLLEFRGNMGHLLKFFVENDRQDFTLPYWKHFGEDTVKYMLHFKKHEKFDRFYIEKYDATLKKNFVIPEQVIAGVNTNELASRMGRVDWETEYDGMSETDVGGNTDQSRIQATLMPGIMSDLQKLGNVSPMGEKLQAAFLYKYWYDTPFQIKTPQVEALRAKHEFSTTIIPRFKITASETYSRLNAKALQNNKTIVMNNENLKFLADRVKYLGFDENLKEPLEKKMREGGPEFQLQVQTEFSKKPFEATLNFRKSESADMYFFNSYHASMERNDGKKVEQTFYLNNGKGITAKEAFNLLDGRAVHKEMTKKDGEKFKAWVQLDPEVRDKNNNADIKQYHEKYGYNLNAAVGKFAVAELNDPEKAEKLMQSLQKGNMQSVTVEKEGSVQSMFMEADPKFKSVKLYDAEMKLVTKESLSRYEAVCGQAPDKASEKMDNDKKKELKPVTKTEKEKVKQGKENSLLPKRRQSTKKGLGIT